MFCLCYKKSIPRCIWTWVTLAKACTVVFHQDYEPSTMCVSSPASEAGKSFNPCFEESKNNGFMSVKQEWLPTFTKIKKKPLIFVKSSTFVPKPQPVEDFSTFLWPLKICVCSQTSEAEKSMNLCTKEWRNDRFMSVRDGCLPTFTKIINKPLNFVKNFTFRPKLQPAGDFFCLLWSLLAN